jgi:hypothetical protein
MYNESSKKEHHKKEHHKKERHRKKGVVLLFGAAPFLRFKYNKEESNRG